MTIPNFTAGEVLLASELNQALADTAATVPQTANTFTEPQTFAGAVNQTPGAGANNSTPFAQYGDLFSDAIMSGLTTTTSSTLSGALESGDAYVIGQRVVYPGGNYTVAASSTSYLDLSNTGQLTVSTSATVTANSLRLWTVTSSATAITAVQQVALQGSPVIKFRALASAQTALTDNAVTIIPLDLIYFNPQNQPIMQANGSLIPTKAGYYQVSYNINLSSSASQNTVFTVYVNGTPALTGFQGANAFSGAGSGLIYFNGVSDYIQLAVYVTASGITNGGGTGAATTSLSLVGPL